MESFREIIEAAGRPSDLAHNLGVRKQVVHNWRARDTLPPEHWRRICELALSWDPPRRITVDDLARIAERRATR